MNASHDYIIIGSGSAGSTIAYRLGEVPDHKVLVLEFGGTDMGPFIQMPAALSYPMNMKQYDWGYKAEACLLYTSPSPRDYAASRMPSSA